MTTPQRYSDKWLKDNFTAYVLLSEPIQFRFPEIWEAVRKDYPDLAWAFSVEVALPFDSATMSMGTYFGDKTGPAGSYHGMINFLSTPGPLDMDMTSMIQKSRFAFPEATQAIAAHRSVFSVSAGSVDATIPARFDAARRMTCLTAIFAKLPTCLGIYFPSADLILPPKTWVAAADMAHMGKFPALQWINYPVAALTETTFTVNTPCWTSSRPLANARDLRRPRRRQPSARRRGLAEEGPAPLWWRAKRQAELSVRPPSARRPPETLRPNLP